MEVDAIEEGKIVHVSEDYARREGLLIIRRKVETTPEIKSVPLVHLRRAERRARPLIDEFRRELDYRKNDVIKELKENFQWDITRKRREKNLTRMRFASMLGVSVDDVISLEHGILPSDNFVLINKVEDVLGIRLKKEQAGQEQAAQQAQAVPERQTHIQERAKPADIEAPRPSDEAALIGEDIELE